MWKLSFLKGKIHFKRSNYFPENILLKVKEDTKRQLVPTKNGIPQKKKKKFVIKVHLCLPVNQKDLDNADLLSKIREITCKQSHPHKNLEKSWITVDKQLLWHPYVRHVSIGLSCWVSAFSFLCNKCNSLCSTIVFYTNSNKSIKAKLENKGTLLNWSCYINHLSFTVTQFYCNHRKLLSLGVK